MKTHPTRRKYGFTLVELLVVIAIIAVLAGAGFAAANAAMQKAKKTTALAVVTGLESAVSNFFTEYGSMPKDNMSADVVVDTKTDKNFLKVLLGTETVSSPLNTRAIKFLNAKEGKNKKNGLIYTGDDVDGLYDPWGGSYKVMLDGNFDEKVKPAPTGGGGPSGALNGRRAAAWSDGADGVTSSLPNKPADDVKNW